MRAGCWRITLYVKGISMMTAAGGAVNESLDSRFTNDATRFAGRCLRENEVMRARLAQCEDSSLRVIDSEF